jgi:HEAT repeat protein
MIRLSLALIGTAILASGCVQGDAPGAGTPATGSPKAQRLSETARLAMTPKPAPVREADASPPAPVIAETLREDPDPEQRREAVYAFADAGAKDPAATLGGALYDPDARVREAAIEAMTGIDDRTAADWLSLALGDPEPRVRRAAVEALGQIGGDTARFLLEQALRDVDAGVREAAGQMLAEPEFASSAVR